MLERDFTLGLLLAKVETVSGTDATPTPAADAVRLLEPFTPQGAPTIKTERGAAVVGNTLQGLPPLKPSGYVGTWPSKFHVRGAKNGLAFAANNLPELAAYYQALGLQLVVDTTTGAEKVTVRPAATGLKGITEYYYLDGQLRKLLGAVADGEFSFGAGMPLELNITRTGLYAPPTDVALPGGAVFGVSEPPIAENVALVFDGYAAGIVRSFSWALGNPVKSNRRNANAASALSVPRIRGRRSLTYKLVIEEPLVADYDLEAKRRNNTAASIAFTLPGAQYSGLAFAAPNARIVDIEGPTDDEGTPVITVTGSLWDSALGANDAFSLVHQ